jgi:S-adenosyl-L-methionine hydrolase (adenosine-forming)
MLQNSIITMLSDFGDRDVYVGVMKGVIAQINPYLSVIDLTHQIPPQNLAAARFCLMNACPYFPAGTVHVAVVDPGVGGQRISLAVEFVNGFLVGPDNGIFSGVLSQTPAIAAVVLNNPLYWRSAPSNTFHGRDIFAPVAAHLASGVALKQLGQEIDPATLVSLALRECTPSSTGINGCIQYIDHFGNLITNIPQSYVLDKTWYVEVAGVSIPGHQTYSDMPTGSAIALIGSHGWVEIAINGGNAELQLQLKLGDELRVKI